MSVEYIIDERGDRILVDPVHTKENMSDFIRFANLVPNDITGVNSLLTSFLPSFSLSRCSIKRSDLVLLL